ncbi:hypothetical protein [Gryllotalpicola protaetiae]|uniref:hypothetical protein n=1 Tax=Gryllotalpicola protaetiae TaxID=2419771 RepID=UPI0013C4D29B|nr:hypothetical protein [Gryllotalpicola protaetiae]
MSELDELTPEDLARELGVTGRAVRSFLRDQYPDHERYARWFLTPEQTTAVRQRVAS